MRQVLRTGFALLCAVAGISQAGVVGSHGALKVSGNKIVDAAGIPIQVAGMSLFWSGWMSKYWNAGVVGTLAKDWNSTLVRAAMGVEGNGNYLLAKDANKSMVNTVVNAAIANDIYVIIDWHDHNATQHTADAVAFFDEMSRLHGKNPHVIFELFNEPLEIPWSDIKSYAQTVIATIRKNSDNLILVGTPKWSQDVDAAAASPLSDANTAYVLHFYAGSHGATLRSKAETALSKGVALFISEWGTSVANGGSTGSPAVSDNKVWTAESDTWLAWAKQNNLSWANWSIADKDESSAALKPGASSSGGWNDGSISPAGLYVRGKIKDVFATLGASTNPSDTGSTKPPPVSVTDTLEAPGRIEAEMAATLSADIKIEATTDAGGGSALGYTGNGSAEYWLRVPQSGTYTLRARVASEETANLIFKVGGSQVATMAVTTTGGWQTWKTLETSVQLSAGGVTKLQVQWNTGSANLNWLELVSGGSVPVDPQPQGDTASIPGRIEAEKASALSTEGIKAETTSDAGGGSNLGYTANGSWAEYPVKIANAGPHVLRLRVATANGGTLGFKLDGQSIGSIDVASTGDWQTWQTKELNVQIPKSGAAKLRLEWSGSSSSLVNLNWMEFASSTGVSGKSHAVRPLHVVAERGGWRIALPEGARMLTVSDLRGRVLAHQILSSEREISIPGSANALMVEVESKDGFRRTLVAPRR